MVLLRNFTAMSPSDGALASSPGDLTDAARSGQTWLDIVWNVGDLLSGLLTAAMVAIAGAIGSTGSGLHAALRRRRLRRIRRRILPRHPDSLICANCLHVVPRRVRSHANQYARNPTLVPYNLSPVTCPL
jgi:hypothetical protein